MSHLRLIVLLLVVGLVMGACTRSQGDDDPSDTPGVEQPVETPSDPGPEEPTDGAAEPIEPSGVVEPEFESAACEFEPLPARSVECGWLVVPADRANPDSGTIRLHVAIFESESSDPAPDPVVYLEGGPGGEPLEALPLVFEDRFAHLLRDRDVIFYDQRGTGYSDPSLACEELRALELELIDEDPSGAELIDRQLVAVTACRDRLAAEGVDLDSFNSAASAADLADLREVLGYDEWNLYGISYGTKLALTTMRDHPEGLRSVILDSTYPLEVDLIVETPANFDRALRELFDACADDPACGAAYPSLEADFYELLRELEDQPITAEVANGLTGDRFSDAVFTGASLADLVFQGLYSEAVVPILPLMIDNVSQGGTYELSLLGSSALVNGEFFSTGMSLSVQCHEEVSFSDPAAALAATEQLPDLEVYFSDIDDGTYTYGDIFDICEVWPAGEALALENEPVTSSIPTLITAGQFDPITPPAWGLQTAETLSNATYVEFPAVGHGSSLAGECPNEIVLGFLADPSAPDLSCVDEMPSPAFVTADTPVPGVTLSDETITLFGPALTVGVPEGWEEVGPGVWIRGENSIDQTQLLQQFAPGLSAGALLDILAGQLGVDDFTPDGSYDTPAGSWQIYRSGLLGAPVSLALVDTADGVGIVLVISDPRESDTLEDTLFKPALDRFTVGS